MKDEERKAILREIIDGRKGFYGYKLPELSEKSGISYSILRRRMQNPLHITFREFLKLDRALHFEDRDKERLMEIFR